MATFHQKFVVVALTMLMVVGSVSNAVAGVVSCLPKACCCTTMATDEMNHTGRMEMATSQKCTPKTPAPCCRVEPFQAKTDLAISSQPSHAPQRMSWVQMIANYTAVMPEQNNLAALKSILDPGPLLKIPIVPIYLQTLSILC